MNCVSKSRNSFKLLVDMVESRLTHCTERVDLSLHRRDDSVARVLGRSPSTARSRSGSTSGEHREVDQSRCGRIGARGVFRRGSDRRGSDDRSVEYMGSTYRGRSSSFMCTANWSTGRPRRRTITKDVERRSGRSGEATRGVSGRQGLTPDGCSRCDGLRFLEQGLGNFAGDLGSTG